jgi:hypothetical protein
VGKCITKKVQLKINTLHKLFNWVAYCESISL